jgi:hypothetical protein
LVLLAAQHFTKGQQVTLEQLMTAANTAMKASETALVK